MNEAAKSVGDTPRRFKRGDVREDGMIFFRYGKTYRSGQLWLSRERFDQERAKKKRDGSSTAYLKKLSDSRKRLRISDPNKVRNQKLKQSYGITLPEYNRLLEMQHHSCAICGEKNCKTGQALCVDHCHKTKKIRGILCRRCNTGIGNLFDDPDILRAAADYLENPPAIKIL